MKRHTIYKISLAAIIVLAIVVFVCLFIEPLYSLLFAIPLTFFLVTVIVTKNNIKLENEHNTQENGNNNESRSTQIELLKCAISKIKETPSGNFCINTLAKINMLKAHRTYFVPEDFIKLFKDGNNTLVFWKIGNDWQVETILTNDDDIANAIKEQIRDCLISANLSKLREMGVDTSKATSLQASINTEKSISKTPCVKLSNCFVDDYCVVDIETTGLSRAYDEIIEICALRVRKNEIVDTFTQLVKPTIPISPDATKVNGITTEMVQNASSIKEVIATFIEFVGDDIVIGHNFNKFDLKFINLACENELGKSFDNPFIDTLELARSTFDYVSNYKLATLCMELGITQPEHRAEADGISTKKLYDKIKECRKH